MNIAALIFAKYPEAGRVNTRLVPPLSHEQAANLHRAALAATCELARTLVAARIVLVVTPDDAVNRLVPELPVPVDIAWPQGDGSLGRRLARATTRALAEGAEGIVLLGADSPTVPEAYLREAVGALPAHDVVMGPSHDGGYYLLGLTASHVALFEDIDWGTGQVAAQTRARAAKAGLRVYELAPWHDIDRAEDLAVAAASLEGAGHRAPQRRALRRELLRLMGHETNAEHDHV
jgi:rSAM/selenodomain-associated transferase 1